jgi:serine/threonine protein kinase
MADIDLNGVVLHGRYRIERPLGRGGMSSVYLARPLALDCPVAVKFIRDDLIEDETVRARFEREARAAARLTHPNVVHVHDFGSFERGAYIVMEYIEGVSLRQLLVDRGRLSLDVAVDLFLQTSEAIAAAHAAGILHRDIKPENLMVYEDETERRRVKVVDFGLAKHLEGEGTRRLTGQSQMIGTPKYMAPERVTGEEVDERADVYALGILLWEMLAGHAPFEGTFKEVIAKHLHEQPPSLRATGVDVPEALDDAIARALAKDPEMRTPSAVALANEVSEALDVQTTPSGALLPLGAASGEQFEMTRVMASAPLPQRIDSEARRTRYDGQTDSEATHVRPRLPTLYIPGEERVDERTEDLPIPLEPLQPAPEPSRTWTISPATIAAIAVAVVAFFAGAFAVRHFLSDEAAQPPAPAAVAEAPAATEPPVEPASGVVTIPKSERTKIVLEMDPKQIRAGAVLSITGGRLEGRQDFPLKRVRGELAWIVSDATRSIPGRITLDEALAPGETYTLVVRNRDGSTSIPKVKVEPVGQQPAGEAIR